MRSFLAKPSVDGRISLSDWSDALTDVLVVRFPYLSLKGFFEEALSDDRRSIDFAKFLSSVNVQFTAGGGGTTRVSDAWYKNRRQLETVFHLVDVDGSGSLSRAEFANACAVVNECSDDLKMSDAEIDTLFNGMDLDGDGAIDFGEFLLSFRLVSDLEEQPPLPAAAEQLPSTVATGSAPRRRRFPWALLAIVAVGRFAKPLRNTSSKTPQA